MRFVLVGGVALQLHGYSGATKDVDMTIADYRDRWDLADTDELLGPLPAAGTPQRADRASLDRQLKRLERLLGRGDAERPGPER